MSRRKIIQFRPPAGKRLCEWPFDVRRFIFKTLYVHPEKDFLITPQTLLEDGTYVESTTDMDPAFDCMLFSTPFNRNLYRLYVTTAYVALSVQYGLPEHPLLSLRAVKHGHAPLLMAIKGMEGISRSVEEALTTIYGILFGELGVVPPVHSRPTDVVAAIM